MRILAMQGGDKRSAWTDLAQHGWGIVNKALEIRSDVTVIILCHSETISDDNGIVKTRIKTNGRKLEKLVLESKMTTVVWAVRQDGKYKFVLSADNSTCKVPMNAFESDIIDTALTMRDDLTVIFLVHSQTDRDDSGYMFTRMKTSGKKLDKIVLESKLTTVLLAECKDGEYVFHTHSDKSTAKTPMGAFEQDEIPNDIAEVLKILEEF